MATADPTQTPDLDAPSRTLNSVARQSRLKYGKYDGENHSQVFDPRPIGSNLTTKPPLSDCAQSPVGTVMRGIT